MNYCRIYSTKLLKTASLMSIVLPVLLGLGKRDIDLKQLCLAFLVASLIISQLSLMAYGWKCPLALTAFVFCSEFLCFAMNIGEVVLLLLVMAGELSVSLYQARLMLSDLRQMPRNDRVLLLVRILSCHTITISVSVFALALLSLSESELAAGIFCLVSASFYAAVTYCSLSGHSLFIGRRRQDELKELLVSTGVRGCDAVMPDRMMKLLYEKVLCVMEEDKPYLREDFSLYELSASVFTNKTYLSKTINAMTGKNFRQFINTYRIRYSIGLMDADPLIKVNELSFQSGFHSTVTFNMAFKLNTGMTPGEYIQRRKLKVLSSREPEPQCQGESSRQDVSS